MFNFRIYITHLRRPTRFAGVEFKTVDCICLLKIFQSGRPPISSFFIGEIYVSRNSSIVIPPRSIHTTVFIFDQIPKSNMIKNKFMQKLTNGSIFLPFIESFRIPRFTSFIDERMYPNCDAETHFFQLKIQPFQIGKPPRVHV